jgi:hypothetical protein
VPTAEYIELFNTHSNAVFDLSGWRFNGVDFTSRRSFIGPRGFLVLDKNRVAFVSAYGPNVQVFGEFSGNLQSGGESLSPHQARRCARSRHRRGQTALRRRCSLARAREWNGIIDSTLIDAAQENSRPANWFATYTPAVFFGADYHVRCTNEAGGSSR